MNSQLCRKIVTNFFVIGRLPVSVLRPGGLHHQQRHHHPQPRRPRAVEERLPAQRVRQGEQGVHRLGRGEGQQGLGRGGHDGQPQGTAGRPGVGRPAQERRGGRQQPHLLRPGHPAEGDEDMTRGGRQAEATGVSRAFLVSHNTCNHAELGSSPPSFRNLLAGSLSN